MAKLTKVTISLNHCSPCIFFLAKQDSFIYILKPYFHAYINCLYQTEKDIINPFKMLMSFAKTAYLSNKKHVCNSKKHILLASLVCVIVF